MRFMKLLFATVAAAALSAPATAATMLKFKLSGDLDTSWTAPASPVPDFSFPSFFGLNVQKDGNIPAVLVSYTTQQNGGFRLRNPSGTVIFFDSVGPQIFSGSVESPTFRKGTYTLTALGIAPGNGTLTISAIPEPASWALMIAGFGLVGSALRRRQVVAAA